MQSPLQIEYRNLERSEALEAAVRKRVEQLELIEPHITTCVVTVELGHKHHQQGNLFHVVIEVRTPIGDVAVSRMPDEARGHEDPFVAVRDAFDAARRQLQDQRDRARGKVKSHDTPPHGRVSELHPEDDHGWILDSEGREVYFHRNAVVNGDFDDLEVGAEVRFAEVPGAGEARASSVHRVGKHHIVG